MAERNAEMLSISRVKNSVEINGVLQRIPIRADAELGTPFFGYNLGKAGHACFSCAIVDLTTARSTVSKENSN